MSMEPPRESLMAALWAAAPHNDEAEQAFLGCVLFDRDRAGTIEGLRPEHFWEPLHARLWKSIRDITAAGKIADPIALADKFASDPAFVELGGIRYLADLIDMAPPANQAEHFAAIISDLAMRRELIALSGETATAAADLSGETTADSIIVAVERGVAAIAKGSTSSDDWRSASDVVRGAIASALERGGRVELSTGLIDLDAVTGGFRRGEMAIIAGRPAMGKSTAGLAMAKALARAGHGVCFFSMEMAEVALGLRVACDVAYDGPMGRIEYFRADRGQLEPSQWHRLRDAGDDVDGWPIMFDVRPGQTTAQMEAKARRQFRKWETSGIRPGAIVVDHLTIAGVETQRSGNKVAEVGDISRGLAEMAKRLDVAVIGLCQLSRDVEKRDGKSKRPGLADLRWSGEIEQDARQVMFLYRPEYYLHKPEGNDPDDGLKYEDDLALVKNKLHWYVEKNNNGPTGDVETFCDMGCSVIRNAETRR